MKLPQLDWKKELEVKIWKHTVREINHDWKPLTNANSKESPFEQALAYVNTLGLQLRYTGEIIDNGCNIVGLVRNIDNTMPFKGSLFCPVTGKLPLINENGEIVSPLPEKATTKSSLVENRDGVSYMNARIAHHKHDMVVYYDDLGGVVRVTGWEGIMSYNELRKNLYIYEQYVGKTPNFMSHTKNTYLCIYTNNGCIDIYRDDKMSKETFYNYMKLIKQSADRLHKIRHSGIQKKAAI